MARTRATTTPGAQPADVLVLAPLALEAKALSRAGRHLSVLRVGMGKERARRAAGALSGHPARQVIVAGFGGAVDEDLRPGDVVVADEVRGPGGPTPCQTEPMLSRLRAAGIAVSRGAVASSSHLVRGVERARLASSGVKAVDMESAWLSPLAYGRHFTVVRVIVDTPARELWHPWATLSGGTRAWRSLSRVGRALSRWST